MFATKLGQVDDTLDGCAVIQWASQAGEMGRDLPHELQQRQTGSPAFVIPGEE